VCALILFAMGILAMPMNITWTSIDAGLSFRGRCSKTQQPVSVQNVSTMRCRLMSREAMLPCRSMNVCSSEGCLMYRTRMLGNQRGTDVQRLCTVHLSFLKASSAWKLLPQPLTSHTSHQLGQRIQ